MADKVIITIDGPAGTGKSTVAHLLAARLGLDFLDTGAMYRAVALLAVDQGIDPSQGANLADIMKHADMHFDWTTDPPSLLLNGRDITKRIRDRDVNKCVSIVALQPEVREVLVKQQQRIADKHPRLVSEGRDQGSIVFPDAQARFYLDAKPEVRAQRRVDQLAVNDIEVDHEQILGDIMERDKRDITRADGPLIKPDGAVEIDTSNLSLDEVVNKLEAEVRSQIDSFKAD